MAYFEGSYKQLLFGVSQQDRKDRLEGQVEAQLNMTSDLTFGLRRRSPTQITAIGPNHIPYTALACFHTEVGGQDVVFLVDTRTGTIQIRNTLGATIKSVLAGDYLTGVPDDIMFAVAGDRVCIGNRKKRPVEVPANTGYMNPAEAGFFYVSAGAFSKEFAATISAGGQEYTVTHTTVSSGTTAPIRAQQEYIAEQLESSFAAHPIVGTANGYQYHRVGSFVFVRAPAGTSIALSTQTGSTFMRASGAAQMDNVANLPPTLPEQADGFIIAVGTGRVKVYYRWDNASKAWVEDAAWSAQHRLDNMPFVMEITEGVWSAHEAMCERRTSGDADSNPALRFTSGITGMTSFQGRLVLMAGEYVCMSGTGRPERWYRSTLASLLPDDPIEIAASTSLATPYLTALQFNQDLVLFSSRYQATIPGNVAITPANATISISANYTTEAVVPPVPVGLSMFFAAPRAAGYAAIWEMTPSPYTERQLTAQDVTGHIPQYLGGPIRWMAASSTTNVLVIGDPTNLRELVIHEYLWQGQEKSHQAWHRWRFQYPIHYGYFVGDVLYLLGEANGRSIHIRVDVRQGAGEDAKTAGRLDYYYETTVQPDGTLHVQETVPQIWAGTDDTAEITTRPVWGFRKSTPFAGTREVLYPKDRIQKGGLWFWRYPVDTPPGTAYRVGVRYTSLVTPSAPVVRDSNDVPITTQRALLHKFVASLQNTGEFTYQVRDRYRELPAEVTSPLKFGSPELAVGAPQVADSTVYIPCRLDMQTALLTLSTDDVYDLNITSLEYGFKYHQRYGRRA